MFDGANFITSLPEKDRSQIEKTISLIRRGDMGGLDVKKLKGYENLFRIRVGAYRIICEKHKKYGFIVQKVTKRNDTTYNL